MFFKLGLICLVIGSLGLLCQCKYKYLQQQSKGHLFASLKDYKTRTYYVEKRVNLTENEAICFRSIGLLKDKPVQQMNMDEFNAIENFAKEMHIKRSSDTFHEKCSTDQIKLYMNHKLPDDLSKGFDYFDMRAMVFQLNYKINHPYSCTDPHFFMFAKKLPIVISHDRVFPTKGKTESFSCFPVFKTNNFTMTDEISKNLTDVIRDKLHEFILKVWDKNPKATNNSNTVVHRVEL